MADNESDNKKPPNGDTFGEIFRESHRHPSQKTLEFEAQEQRRLEAEDVLKIYERVYHDVNGNAPEEVQVKKRHHEATVGRLGATQKRAINSATSRASGALEQELRHHTSKSAVNAFAESFQDDPDLARRAQEIQADPEGGRAEAIARRGRLERARTEIPNLAKGAYVGKSLDEVAKSGSLAEVPAEKRTEIEEKLRAHREDVKQEAAWRHVQGIKRGFGKDEESVNRAAMQAGTAAQEHVERQQLEKQKTFDIGGKSVGGTDVFKALEDATKKVAEAMKKLETETGNEIENKKLLIKASEEQVQAQKASAAVSAQYAKRAGQLAAGASFANIAGGAWQELNINQPMQKMSNIAGYANLANEQYDMYKKARGGDVASQMLMSQWKNAAKFGNDIGESTKTVQDIQIGASALDIGAGGVQAAGSWGTGGTGVIEGGMRAANAVATGITVGADRVENTTVNANRLQAIQAAMAAQKALGAISAEQRQTVRDAYVGMGTVGMEMGGGAKTEKFLSESMNIKGLTRMERMRMSPEQFVQMSAQGVRQMGSTFNEEQVYAARGLEKTGLGSMTENMQRMATLSGAGTNQPQAALADVIAAGMTKGIEGSKAISMMVENTASLTKFDAMGMAAGIDVTGATAAQLAANIDPNSKNKEFSIERAMSMVQQQKAITEDTSVSWSGLVNTARISKETGLGGQSAIAAAGISTAELKAMSKMGEPERRRALIEKGVDVNEIKEGMSTQDFIAGQQRRQKEQMFTKSIGRGDLTATQADLVSKTGDVRELMKTKEGESILAKLQHAFPGKTATEAFTMTKLGVDEDPKKMTEAQRRMKGEGGGAVQTAEDKLRTGAATQMAVAAAAATTQLGDFKKALQKFSDLQAGVEIPGAEQKATTAAADLTKNMSEGAAAFPKAVTDFQNSAKAMHEAANLLNQAILGKASAVSTKTQEKLTNILGDAQARMKSKNNKAMER
jgi:hypothetical protein